MWDRIKTAVFSFSGLGAIIGVAGFLSALVTMFIDGTSQVSIRWIIFVLFIAGTLIVILLKIVFDLSRYTAPPAPFERPIKFISEENILVIRRNDNFVSSIVVACYFQKDEIDRLAYVGVVHVVQDKIIQIKIHRKFIPNQVDPKTDANLKLYIVRPVVPVDALEMFQHGVES